MKVRQGIVCLVVVGVLLGLAAVALAEENPITYKGVPKVQADYTIRIGHSVNMEWSSHTAFLKRFAELLAVYSNNRIRAEIYPGSQLGSEWDMIQGLRLGTLEVTLPAVNNLAGFAPAVGFYVLPYMFENIDEVYAVQDQTTDWVNPKVIEQAGARILGWEVTGWRVFFYNADKPIEHPENLRSLKMRVPPNPIMIDTYKAWGA